MKALVISMFIIAASLLGVTPIVGQTTELTIEVQGIKEAKGNILIAVKSSEDPKNTIYDKVAVEKEGTVVCVLKNVPVGKVDVSVFQDLDENFQLNMDEQNIPIEPCCKKDKVKIKESGNKLVMKLVNVKDMMKSSF